MTKKEYLHILDNELVLLDEEIADDILEYYKNRFEEEKRFENKSETEIIEALGDPYELAKRIYSSYGIKPEKWQSARQEDVDVWKAVGVISFDILVASWLIPLLVFVTLSVLAAFVTFPFVMSSLPSFGLSDRFLIIVFSFGVYSLLILLILGLTEITLIITRMILILNVKILSPRNKTTSRMLKGMSLFQWMRSVKMGRNIFLNLGMIAISIVAISFLIITTERSDILSAIGAQPSMENTIIRDLTTEIEGGDEYRVKLDVGDMQVSIVRNHTNEMKIEHKYNMDDFFTYVLDEENNILRIQTQHENIQETFLSEYDGSITLSLPDQLIVDEMIITAENSTLEVLHFSVNSLQINISEGNINLFKTIAIDSEITNDNGNVSLLYFDSINTRINMKEGYLFMSQNNNVLSDGEKLAITNLSGDIYLEDVFYEEVIVIATLGDFSYMNRTNVYEVGYFEITSSEGLIILEVPIIEEVQNIDQE